MPGVWLSVDHLCIAWCKQVVSTVVRSLFDMINPSTMQLTHDEDQRREILNYHFVKVLLFKQKIELDIDLFFILRDLLVNLSVVQSIHPSSLSIRKESGGKLSPSG